MNVFFTCVVGLQRIVFCAAGPRYSRVEAMTVPKGGTSQSLHAFFCIYTSIEMCGIMGCVHIKFPSPARDLMTASNL